jgi:uncharacterized protein YlaI
MPDTKHKLPKPACEICGKEVHVKEDGTATDAITKRHPITKQIRSYTCQECEDRTKKRARKLAEKYITGETDKK